LFKPDLVKLFLELGANANFVDREYICLSTVGYATYNKNVEMVRLLLEHGACVDGEKKLFKVVIDLNSKSHIFLVARSISIESNGALGVFIWITSDIILENVNQCPDSRALRISSRKFLSNNNSA
jgi:ankyrin repeat protein